MLKVFKELFSTSTIAPSNVILFVDLENLTNPLWKLAPRGINSFEEFQERCKKYRTEDIGAIGKILAPAILQAAKELKERGIKKIDWIIIVAKEDGHKCLLNSLKSTLERKLKEKKWKTLVSYQLTGKGKETDDQFITTIALKILTGDIKKLDQYAFAKSIPTVLQNQYEEIKLRIKNKEEGIAILSNDKDFYSLQKISNDKEKIFLLNNFDFIKNTKGRILISFK